MRATKRFVLPLNRWTVMLAALLLGTGSVRAQPPPAPPRQIVTDVTIVGSNRSSNDQLLGQLKTRANMEYSKDAADEDVRTLLKTGQFEYAEAQLKGSSPGKVQISFWVRERPGIINEIIYQGAKHLKDDALNEVTYLRKGSPLNENANRNLCSKIVERYHEEGRLFASCELLEGGKRGDTRVVFNITEGPIVRVRGIEIEGNTFVSAAVLKTHIKSSSAILGLFGQYNPKMSDADINELITYYKTFGFLDVRIGRELRWAPDGKDVILIYHVQEGIRYRIETIPNVEGNLSVPREQLQAMSWVRPPDYFNENVIKKDMETYKNYFGEQGRLVNVSFVPHYSRDLPGVVQVQYEIQEKPPARVGQIQIIGNDRTRDNVILRQVQLYPGQWLSYPAIIQSENNLKRLGIFQTTPETQPKVEVIEDGSNFGQDFKDVRISVKEADTGSLQFGIGASSNNGLTGTISLTERNFDITRVPTSFDDFLNGTAFRGAGQQFNLMAMPGTIFQTYSASFQEPYLFDTPNSLLASGYYYQRYYNEYLEERTGLKMTLGRRLTPLWSISATGRVENVGVHDVSSLAPIDYTSVIGNHGLYGLRGGFTRDSRDSYIRPTSGSLFDISYEEVTGDYTFPLASLRASEYFTVYQRADGTGRHVLNFWTQAGWAGSNTPVYERYFAGGINSIRGFMYRGVGPSVNGYKVGGDFLLLNSVEYQIPIKANDQIYMVAFVDSGTVSPNVQDFSQYRVSAGFGIRFSLPMFGPMPIALDLGFPIHKAPYDNTQIFMFNMGVSR